ncbi:D-hydantoinase [Myriangium duriaei CBS 260.36]|uniref:D-hydantoinase n=1 Tax=Myriangium duriaei CBS 260.36 TaxID=1168546 RepID=A0A9P4J120_9PEZI|nr:D-hydantoinase [Myriangium duriaei CBS 260.36]
MTHQYDLIITNGVVVTAIEVRNADVAIKNGKIAAIEDYGSFKDATTTRTIDAEGGWVMPGGIDCHVHLEEPPLFGKGKSADTFETGTRSAICGGTTTIVPFAPQIIGADDLISALDAAHGRADGNCYTDYSFHMLVANPTEKALSEFPLLRQRGISSLKIYMTYAALKLSDYQILDVLLASRAHRITTMIHAENNDVILWMTDQLERRRLFDPKYHATSHPAMAEYEATYRAICLSSFLDAPILLVHVSSPVSAAHIRSARSKGLPVYAETCPQYLFLTAADLDRPGFEGAKCVCSPPPRESADDHEGIWQALEDGTFPVLSSDHCPFVYDDAGTGKKTSITEEYPNGRFKYIPNGCPGVETRLPLTISAGRLDPRKFVEVTATNPAKLYGLWPRKGDLISGESDADLVVWYPDGKLRPFELVNGMLHHNVDYSPYEGKTLKQWPRYTILRGEVVWDRDGGGLLGKKGYGQFLPRGESSLQGSLSDREWDIPGVSKV